MPDALPSVFLQFQAEAEKLGASLNGGQINQFYGYLNALQEWNRTFRLVSKTETETIVWHHFLDSLSALPLLTSEPHLLDLGSGAGFPGIPLKIALPTLEVHLVESQRRRAHFLKHVIRELNLQKAVVHQCRLGSDQTLGAFRSIVSRAVAAPDAWLPAAINHLDGNGQIILMLGPSTNMTALYGLLGDLGLQPERELNIELPVIARRRFILSARRKTCFT